MDPLADVHNHLYVHMITPDSFEKFAIMEIFTCGFDVLEA
jgi:hypothetical protein